MSDPKEVAETFTYNVGDGEKAEKTGEAKELDLKAAVLKKFLHGAKVLTRKVMSGYVNNARLDKAIGDLNDTEFLREVNDGERRKMNAVGIAGAAHSNEDLDKQMREQIHHNVARQREAQKKSMIMEKLKDLILSERETTPSYGAMSFFENTFTNSSLDQVFHLRISEPTLKTVCNAEEWKALRSAQKKPVDRTKENMIDKDKMFSVEMRAFLCPLNSRLWMCWTSRTQRAGE